MISIQAVSVITPCLFYQLVNRLAFLTVARSNLLYLQTLDVDDLAKSVPLLLDFDQDYVFRYSQQVKALFLEG